jgi:anti-sigma B factor antagonist/stage II sporulation protein AA (anti-sigma F factor antagonist)
VDLSTHCYVDVIVAAPAGRIDHSNADAPVLSRVGAAGCRAVVLDFARVEYISSMGLRVLMMAAKTVRAQQGRIGITALQSVVGEIFAISRFDHVLEVFPTVADALTAFSPAAEAAYRSAAKPDAP